MKNKIMNILLYRYCLPRLMLLMTLLSLQVNAEIICYQSATEVPEPLEEVVIPLKPTMITATDTPIGTVLVTQYFTTPVGIYGFFCNNTTPPTYPESWPATFAYGARVLTAPLGLAKPAGAYNLVFPTNVPGVGVTFEMNKKEVPDNINIHPLTQACVFGKCRLATVFNSVGIRLIKTGVIPPGNHTVQASQFPTFAYLAGAHEYPPLDEFLHIAFSGSFEIVAKTCTVQDVDVYLGEYNSSYFDKAITSDWVDFNIELVDCPAFYGTGEFSHWNMSDLDTPAIPPSFITKNTINLSLKALTTLYARNKVTLDNTSGNAASGLVIEVQSQKVAYSDLFNSMSNQSVALTTVSGASYSVPLRARYSKIGTVTGGEANAAVEFIIEYR